LTKRTLKVDLTDAERLDLGRRLALEQQHLAESEDRKAEVAAAIKAEIESHEKTINLLSRTLNHGYDYREVECEVHLDFNSNRVAVARTDNGEVVEERAMTADERQRELPVV